MLTPVLSSTAMVAAARASAYATGHALVGKAPIHRLEAMAAESDMIDDARIGSLLLASLRVVVEM